MHKRTFLSIVLTCSVCLGYGQIGNSMPGISDTLGIHTVAQSPLLGIAKVSFNQTCFSECFVPLPVAGLKLKAKRLNKNNVLLNWSTITEINNKGFFMQRSLGTTSNFENTGFVAAVGNSVQKINYDFNDVNPFSGITYYRLQQHDLDGHITYSNVAEVKGIDNNRFIINPNPAQNSCTIVFAEALSHTNVTVSILDISGKLAFQKVYTSGQGSSIKLENLSSLKSGTYIVTVDDGGKRLLGKLTIAN